MAAKLTWYEKMTGHQPQAADPDGDDVEMPSPHPVLSAALAAGVDTPEKFAQVLARADTASVQPGQIAALTAENTALKTERDQAKAALAAQSVDVRATAKKNAAIAYAADETARLHALEDIDATVDGPALGRMAARMEASAKAAVPDAGGSRTTSGVDAPEVVRQPAQDAAGKLTAEQKAAKKNNLLALAGISTK